MPPPPRHRAPHLLPVQSHHRLPQAAASSPSPATNPNNPYQQALLNPTNTISASSESLNHQSNLLLVSNDGYSPIDDGRPTGDFDPQHPGSVRRARLEAEARKQQEYRLLNEDGDSIIDFYNHTTGDEGKTGGGGLSSANQSPIDFPHGNSSQHNLLWHHHQQRIIQRIQRQQESEQQPGNHSSYDINKNSQGPFTEETKLYTAEGIAPSHTSASTPSSATLGGSNIRNLEENLIAIDRDLQLLKIVSSTRDSLDGGIVERVIEQPYYPPVPKLTSSPTHFQISTTNTPKIPPHAPSSVTPSHSHNHRHHPHTNVARDPDQQLYYEEQQFSSSQAEEDPEGEQRQHGSGSETENSEELTSEQEEEEEEEDMSTSSTPPSWISSFCSLQGHEYFAEVSEEFIEDDFNLTGLSTLVPMYKESLEMILDVEPDEDEEENSEEEVDEDDSQLGGRSHSRSRKERQFHSSTDMETLESQAELLYGLIHQRFITSRQGMQVMYEKYQNNHFGYCPRVYCNQAKVVPCGYSDTPGVETVKLYCPSCMDIYVPPNSRFQSVDGAFFGTTFPALFFLTFPDLEVCSQSIPASISSTAAGGPPGGVYKPSPSQLKKQKEERGELRTINGALECNIGPGLGKNKQFEMKIYGFRVNERAKGGPRMKWLRSKPVDVGELDEAMRFERQRRGTGEGEDRETNEEMEEDGGDERVRGGTPLRSTEGLVGNRVEKKPVRRSARRRQ